MSKYTLLAGALVLAAACNEPPPQYAGADTGLAVARTKSAKDSLIILKDSLLAVKERQLSLQSQLIGDAATSARLVSEINADLSKARIEAKASGRKPESGIQNASDELLDVQQKVKVVLERLNASDARIRRMRADSVSRTMLNAQQAAQIAEYELSITQLRATVEQQVREIALLGMQVDSLGRENVALTAKNVAMAAHEDSVFVAIGTEKELTEKGVIRREGGTLLAFGRGKTIVPARALEREDFVVLSKTRDVTIQLPVPDKEYRVVSRQNLEFTDSSPTQPLVKGQLHVTDPEKFWAPSKYLILVQR